MKYLFSKTGNTLLESLTFAKTLYAFDFDGTLAEIVQDPEKATMNAKTSQLLRNLNSAALVAVISGRSVRDLKKRLPFKPRFIIGNHGLEGLQTPPASLAISQATCRSWAAQMEKGWARKVRDPAVSLEDKEFSLALHYRRSRNKKEARQDILEMVGGLNPSPRIIMGKSVVNLIPAGAPHKGVTLLELMVASGVNSALYIGDDETDEDVFSLPDSRVFSIRVGYKKTSRAHFFLKRQAEVSNLLEKLVSFHHRNG